MKLIFCRIYEAFKSRRRDAADLAMIILALILTIDILCVLGSVTVVTGFQRIFNNGKLIGLVVAVCSWQFYSFLYIRNDKYIKIYKEYHQSPIKTHVYATRLTIGYCIGSVLLMALFLWIAWRFGS